MNTKVFALPSICCLVLSAAAISPGRTALAQSAAANPPEEITVEAPRLVREQVGRTSSGAKVELISLKRHVSYADLDLEKHADVMTLHERINDTAKEACGQLAKMYPLAEENGPDCVRAAVKDAMAQAETAIEAAAKQ